MIGNDEIQSEPLETYHVYIWKEEEPETVVDSTLVKPQPRDNHDAIMMLVSSFVMALFVIFVPNSPVSAQIVITHTFRLSDLQSHLLSPITSSQSITVMTTGRGHQDATRSRGYLTFYNGLFTGQTIAQGTILTGADNVQIVTDQDAFIPAAAPPLFGQVSVPAHALHAGAAGNISAYQIDDPCCATSVKAVNTSDFTGGRDARNFHVVAQRDIEGGALPLTQLLYSQERKALHAGPDDALIPLPCSSTVVADRHIGEEAAHVTIHVAATCLGIAYSKKSLQEKARELVHIPTGFITTKIAVNVVRTTRSDIAVAIQCTISYNFPNEKEW